MDRLIRSSASIVGIPPSAVSDNPRTNLADGGVDTEVSVAAASDPWRYFTMPTAWQYKAVEAKSMTDSKLTEEIEGESKTYVRKLIQKGYGYRICIADDETAERKAEMEAVLNAAIWRVRTDSPACIVLFAAEITAWTNAFPAIAAYLSGSGLSGSGLSGFFHFKAWEENARSSTKTFVPTPESAVIRESVRIHLDWKNKPISPKLTVSGDAGVGKTRTTFEAIADLEEIRSLTLYTEDEDYALEIATELANLPSQYAIIVADECMDTAAYRIERALQGCKDRVRLITIDNAMDRNDRTELQLARTSRDILENILRANFPQIDQTRLFRYSNLADGSLRFGISLCLNDDLIVQQGHIGHFLSDTKSYLGTLFGPDRPFEAADKEALDLIALVERCGVVGNVEGELTELCAFINLNPSEVKQRLQRMQKTNGLVGRAGRYFYVTPTPIAMVCFQSAWSRWAELDSKSFLERFPRILTASFLARVSRASREVGEVVTAYFRNWILSTGGEIFSNQSDTQQLLLLVESNPDEMMRGLHSLVVSSSRNQLSDKHSPGRRAVVTEALEVARFPDWFGLAEDMLFNLALNETEPKLGNNATELWKSLFPIINPVVASPFQERLSCLDRRLEDTNPNVRILCVQALQEATDERSVYLASPSTFGRRVPPSPWRPKTWDEYFSYVQNCLSRLSKLCLDADEGVKAKAATALVASIRYALSRGILEPAKVGAGEISKDLKPVLRSELRELLLLTTSEYSRDSEEEASRRVSFIETWLAELAPDDLHSQLIEEIGPDEWSHYLEQESWEGRVAKLAERLVGEPNSLEGELSWLNTRKAGSAVQLGLCVGRVDTSLSHLSLVVSASRDMRADRFAQGYFEGAAQMAQTQSAAEFTVIHSRLNAALDELWHADPSLAFNVMLPSGDFLNSFSRAIAGVEANQIPAEFLRAFAAWNGRRHTSSTEARLAVEVLLRHARAGDGLAAATGLDFIQFLLMRHQEEPKTGFLVAVFEDPQLDTIFGLLEHAVTQPKTFPHSFTGIFARVLPADPLRAARLVVGMMKSKDYEVNQAASGLLHSVASLEPRALMDAIGDAMLDRKANLSFLVSRFPITVLPTDVLIEWLGKKGVEGARILTRHLPGPFVGDNGPELHPATRFVMENFGNDKGVFSTFAASIHSGVFAGPMSGWAQRRASLAKQFLDYPLESVRQWAQGELQWAYEQVKQFKEREEEEGF
jgi:hypothetical protein